MGPTAVAVHWCWMGSPETDEASIPMDNRELDELENPATWKDDEGTVYPPVQQPRAVVSVRLTPQEVERLEHEASALGLVYRSSSGMPH